MAKKYLFSPVGNTDPIKYFRDGSLLHICRHYKPDVVYLYLSKEMVENHDKDDRYVRTLRLLEKSLHHSFDIRVIRDEEMVNVQRYDVFYTLFRDRIRQIEHEKEKEDVLLVNMASGTPAMKSALMVMATLAEYRFLPIQVGTPKKKSNLEHEEREEYDVEANWELNEDNVPDAENRCEETKSLNLVRLLKLDIIKKHLLAYDYQAAFIVGKDMEEDLSKTACQWLRAARARSVLELDQMNQALPKGNGVLTPVKAESRKRLLFEYALILDLKVRRGEYADFLRAITPLGVDLLEMVLSEYCDIQIGEYYTNGAHKKWRMGKLQGTDIGNILQSKYNGNFKGEAIYSAHLNAIIQEKCENLILKKNVNELVEIEHKVRNIAAHNIVSVTESWVKEQTGKNVSEIMWLVRYICEQVKINVKKENWDSYDAMNQEIIRVLEEQ